MTTLGKSNGNGDWLVRSRIHWGGILAGVLAGVITYTVLSILGLAAGLLSVQSGGIDALGGFAIGGLIFMVIAMAFSAYLGGVTTARAAAFLTPAQGRFNGLLTGMLLLVISTFVASNLLFAGLNRALGLAGSALSVGTVAASTAADGQGTGALGSLGLDDEYQALVNGFNEAELVDIIAQSSPELNEAQVQAAATTIGNVVRNAGRNIGNNLGNLSNLGDVVGRQVSAVEQALSGDEFVTRLQRRGLSQAQATEVATVIRQRFAEIRTQAQQTTETITRTTAAIASSAAWIWLLVAGLVIGFATFGGGRGGELEPVRTNRSIDTPRANPSEVR